MKNLKCGLIVCALTLASGAANASLCGVPGDGLDTTDVTFRTLAADDCGGVHTGNDSVATMTGEFGEDNWSFLTKYNIGTGDVAGDNIGDITFHLDSLDLGTSGGFELSWSGTDFPITGDIAVVLKSSNGWASYLFEAEEFLQFPNTDSGTFEISFLNASGNVIGDISHLSVYGGESLITTQSVPEPTSLALFGLGLTGLGIARRKKYLKVA